MEATVSIQILGDFKIWVNGSDKAAKLKHSKKGTQFFLLILLSRNESISFEKLQKQIWKNDNLKNPESTFKTLLSRTRKLLYEICPKLSKAIIAKNTSLSFVMPSNVEIDLYTFYDICASLKNIDELNSVTVHQFEEVLYLYRGDIFSYDDDNFSLQFVSNTLQEKYIETSKHYIELLHKKKNEFMVVNVAEQILRIVPTNIDMQITSMKAYAECGFHNTAMQKYSEYTNTYLKNNRDSLPKKYKEFFKEFIKGFDALPMDIDNFKLDVVQNDVIFQPGGFTCDYQMFKNVFNLMVRVSERINITNVLVLIQLNSRDSKPPVPEKLNQAMKICENIIKRNLRKTDIISRFSSSQFSLILFNANLEKSQMVIERIYKSFNNTTNSKNWVLEYKMDDMFNSVDSLKLK